MESSGEHYVDITIYQPSRRHRSALLSTLSL
jgi:hypothetical protein